MLEHPGAWSDDKESDMEQYKTCTKCKQTKSVKEFYRDNSRIDGRHPYCRGCQSANNNRYKENNPDAVARNKKEWAITNKTKVQDSARKWQRQNRAKANAITLRYRAAKKKVSLFKVTEKDIKKILSKPCAYCGAFANHVDHVIPISRGGLHGIGNLVPACATCNTSKNNKTIMEWKKVRGW